MAKNNTRVRGGDLLVQSYKIHGYSPGDFLPAQIGESVAMEFDCISLDGVTAIIRLGIDAETAIALAKSILVVGVQLGVAVE